MQVFVLGMHRSGTSTVARLLNMMGCYFGPEGLALEPAEDNQKGFWERRDVKELNDYLLKENGANWYHTSSFDVDNISGSSRDQFVKRARTILNGMDAYRPWMAKDPRFCLTFPLWRPLLEKPICVQVFRNPYEVALSLHKRNNFPITFSLALWARYQKEALRGSIDLPNILVDYNQLLSYPVEITRALFDELKQHQVRGISMPGEDEIRSFIREELHHQQAPEDFIKHLSKDQTDLYQQLKNGQALRVAIGTFGRSAAEIEQLKFFDENLKLQKEIEALRSKVKSVESQSQDYKTALEGKVGEIKEKDKLIQELKSEISVLSSQKMQEFLQRDTAYEKGLAQLTDSIHAISAAQTSGQQEIIDGLLHQRKEQEFQLISLSGKFQELEDGVIRQSNNINQLLDEKRVLEIAIQQEKAALGKALEEERLKHEAVAQELAFSSQLSRSKIILLEEQLAKIKKDLQRYYAQLDELQEAVLQQGKELQHWQQQLQTKLRGVQKRLNQDGNVLRELNQLHAANLNSWRWKVGNGMIRLVEQLLLRRKVPLATDRMSTLLNNATGQSARVTEEVIALRKLLDQGRGLGAPAGYTELHSELQQAILEAQPKSAVLQRNPPVRMSGIRISLDQVEKSLKFSDTSVIGQKFRVTIISPSTNIHGGTKRLLMIAKLLHLRGHQVTFARQFPSRELDWFDLGLPVKDAFFNEETPVSEVEKLLPDADVIITYGNNRANVVLNGLSAAKGQKFQLFMHFGVHNEALDIQNAGLDQFQLLCTTSWIGEQLAPYAASTPQRIDFGIHNDQFYPTRAARPLRIGALYHKSGWKRTSDVLIAYQKILAESEFSNLKLILYGQEEEPDLMGVDCEYLYDPSQDEIREIYSSCAIWITPSLFEGIGMCSVEAMLCKTPLVTVDTGGSRDFCDTGNSIIIEKRSPEAIKDAVVQLLRNPAQTSAMAEVAYRDICNHSWSNSIDLLEIAIGKATSLESSGRKKSQESPSSIPVLSIGIPVHNQLDYVQACLRSIRENTHFSYEIILVDDCSDEETHQYLSAQQGPNTTYIRNTQQRGFPYNCNTILLYAKGRYVCLLNSDTVVTDKWDQVLIETLMRQPNLAMVGPSTSYGVAKNYDKVAQQLEEVHFKRFDMTYEDIQDFARLNNQREQANWEPTEYVNGFCMMLQAEVVAKVGFFDTAFGLGSREEVQYVDRLREEGYEVGWVKGAYVHHYGHRSFSTLEDSQQLWAKNKELYFSTKGQVQHLGVTKKKIAFIYNAKNSSSTRKRTFEPVSFLRRFVDVDTRHWSEVTAAFIEQYDILILQRLGALNEPIADSFKADLFQWISTAEADGKTFIYDIDDLVIHAQDDLPEELIRRCHYVSVSTPPLAQFLTQYNPQTVVLPNGIDLVRFRCAEPKSTPAGVVRCMCFSLAGAGASAYEKIAEGILAKYPNFEFHLFSGEKLDEEQYPHVHIHRNVDLDELFAWLKSADYVINWDSHSDDYFEKLHRIYRLKPEEESIFINCKSGLKYYNAAVSKCIFITTRRPAVYSEIVRHRENGFLVDAEHEACEIILWLEENEEEKRQVLQNAYEDVVANYALENTVRNYLDFFSSL